MTKPVFSIRCADYPVDVFFWKSKRAYQVAIRKYYPKKNTTVACYVAYGDKRELHFIKPFLGAGYVVHELFHLCFHVMKPSKKNEERFALLLEETTRCFWDSYYMLPENLEATNP